ncbi:glycoside hydrolase family 15 protein [Halorubellus sp. PRR65]|uniref:glycoside hydrolase family 15 protein n=1 Tax=Halorubellus sp. PRR65 TaxID=3098148 RepID=UPI002B25955B|nr:glycoside hydrolase family 15 protein [Halorubellus sp. PRR65]
MNLRDSLHDHARNRDHPTRFPGERRTTAGLFSGLDGRLVHVGRDGRLRDFSAPLLDRAGLATARVGVRVDGEVRWLDAFDARSQRYVDDTALVESTYADGDVELTRLDLTLDSTHLTHVDVSGPADALVVYCSFRPDGQEARVGKLVYDDRDVVETYHRHEHDYLASATGFAGLDGRRPADAGDVLENGPRERPRDVDLDDYEESRLGGDVVATVPVEDGTATVATVLERDVDDRDAVVESVRDRVRNVDATSLAEAARAQAPDSGDEDDENRDGGAAADVRALALLSGPTGARVAGPDFDPLYANSGGYGYTWFRDDAEITRYLLAVDRERDLGLDDWHHRSAALYVDTQLDDGSWPHRVWPSDGSLAPGWANSRVEGGGEDYQADQTASVVAALADYHRYRQASDGTTDDAPALDAVTEAISRGVDALDDTLEDDGLPGACQNAWEDMNGRFAHTAATYLAAYASVARVDAPADSPVDATHATAQARAVLDGLDELWVSDRGAYALRLADGERDDRLDASTFALVDAVSTAAAAGVDVDDHLPRLVSHTATTLDGLERETDAVRGLVRYEGDDWRQREQDAPKVWTVSTAWGAVAAAELAALLERVDGRAEGETSGGRDARPADVDWTADDFGDRADTLLAELDTDGTLSRNGDYLPEQVFDDGTADSATPLGWPHAIRLATATKRRETEAAVPVAEDD